MVLVLRLSLLPCPQFHPHSNGFSNPRRKGSGSSPLENGNRRGRAGKFGYVRLLFESPHTPHGKKWGRNGCVWGFLTVVYVASFYFADSFIAHVASSDQVPMIFSPLRPLSPSFCASFRIFSMTGVRGWCTQGEVV